ncbi:hypothetical protein ARMGADRAFT_1169439 [Armillaria gallica]|uniref:Uncharacterized protein n=1 Tax=Armillaria gallica TaxID=47427 RepID=A0A2H3CRK9_ARMGA|nr:hypothetical protein ARMGADRAFT_1169439 [Armillaria gallica]
MFYHTANFTTFFEEDVRGVVLLSESLEILPEKDSLLAVEQTIATIEQCQMMLKATRTCQWILIIYHLIDAWYGLGTDARMLFSHLVTFHDTGFYAMRSFALQDFMGVVDPLDSVLTFITRSIPFDICNEEKLTLLEDGGVKHPFIYEGSKERLRGYADTSEAYGDFDAVQRNDAWAIKFLGDHTLNDSTGAVEETEDLWKDIRPYRRNVGASH